MVEYVHVDISVTILHNKFPLVLTLFCFQFVKVLNVSHISSCHYFRQVVKVNKIEPLENYGSTI